MQSRRRGCCVDCFMNVAVSDRQPCFGGASGQVVGTRAVRHETRGPLSMDGHRHWGTLACGWWKKTTELGSVGGAQATSMPWLRPSPVDSTTK